MIASYKTIEKNYNSYSNFMRMFRSDNSPAAAHSIIADKFSAFNAINPQKNEASGLSLVPFSFGDQWFAFDTQYFEEAIESRNIYNYDSDKPDWLKGIIVYNNLYVPCLNLFSLLGFQDDIVESKIMIVVSDSARYLALEANSILRPEKLGFNINAFSDSFKEKKSFIAKNILLKDNSAYILNIDEMLRFVEEERF